MKVSRKAPEPVEDEIQITLSQEEAKALAAIVGTNPTDVRERWERTFLGIYVREFGFDNFKFFSRNLYNQLRDHI